MNGSRQKNSVSKAFPFYSSLSIKTLILVPIKIKSWRRLLLLFSTIFFVYNWFPGKTIFLNLLVSVFSLLISVLKPFECFSLKRLKIKLNMRWNIFTKKQKGNKKSFLECNSQAIICGYNTRMITMKCEKIEKNQKKISLLTVLETFSQVFLSRKMEELVKAAQICRTPLKLCRHRQMSATAAHFSMTITLLDNSVWRRISDVTARLISLNRRVMSRIWWAFVIFSHFIQAVVWLLTSNVRQLIHRKKHVVPRNREINSDGTSKVSRMKIETNKRVSQIHLLKHGEVNVNVQVLGLIYFKKHRFVNIHTKHKCVLWTNKNNNFPK